MKSLKEKGFRFKEVVPGIILAISCCFMLFFYAPLELYFTNKKEFWYDIYTLAPVMLVVFLAMAVLGSILFLVLYCISKKLYQAGLVAVFIALVASYIQGNYLIRNLPPLDGSTVDWSRYSGERIKSIVLWVVVAAAVLILIKFIRMKKFYSVVKIVPVCVFLMLGVTLATVCMTNQGFERKLQKSVTDENLLEMSGDSNLVILVLDAVDARTMTELMEVHPEYAEVFEDFTYYPNTVGAYGFTQMSIPYILSGEWFQNEQPFVEYSTDVYKNAQLFFSLEQEGYKMGMYEPDLLSNDESVYRFDNIESCKSRISNYLSFAIVQTKLVGLKYAPFDLKRFCVVDTAVFNLFQEPEEDSQLFRWDNVSFYRALQTEPITQTNEKCFKFIHIEGGHTPFRYDENVNIVENATYESNVEASVTITKTWLEKLKEAGVYDNTAIIVMSDHGYTEEGEGSTLPRHNPILFVKGINEKHEFEVSNAPISYEDLQEAYTRLRAGKGGEEVFDAKEGDVRKRRYLYYVYLSENHIEEYFTEGEAKDVEALYPSGEVYER